MRGIKFIVNHCGEPTSVVIDLKMHGALWEDIYDSIVAESRKDEPMVPWEEVKQRLMVARKLRKKAPNPQ